MSDRTKRIQLKYNVQYFQTDDSHLLLLENIGFPDNICRVGRISIRYLYKALVVKSDKKINDAIQPRMVTTIISVYGHFVPRSDRSKTDRSTNIVRSFHL